MSLSYLEWKAQMQLEINASRAVSVKVKSGINPQRHFCRKPKLWSPGILLYEKDCT